VQAQKIDSSGKFEKLVFHSSRCYGTCPEIHFQIDRNGIMMLNRQFYQSKSESDTSKSGNFKGFLTKEQFKKLLTEAVLHTKDYKFLKRCVVTYRL
jgi:molecular chaperone DnaK (HSP70)